MTPFFIEITPHHKAANGDGSALWIPRPTIWLNVSHIVSISPNKTFVVLSLADGGQYYVPIEQVESLIGVTA